MKYFTAKNLSNVSRETFPFSPAVERLALAFFSMALEKPALALLG